MQTFQDLPPGVALSADGRLDTEVGCARCGYVLRGLLPGDACPECGEPVAESLRADQLRFADGRWLRRVMRGLVVLAVAYGMVIGVFFAAQAMTWLGAWSMPVMVVQSAVSFAVVIVWLVGLWMVTAPDPAVRRVWPFAVLARVAACADAALIPCAIGAPFVAVLARSGAWSFVAGYGIQILGDVTGVVANVALVAVMVEFARRLPARTLAVRLESLAWLIGGVGAIRVTLSVIHGYVIWQTFIAVGGGAGFAGGSQVMMQVTQAVAVVAGWAGMTCNALLLVACVVLRRRMVAAHVPGIARALASDRA